MNGGGYLSSLLLFGSTACYGRHLWRAAVHSIPLGLDHSMFQHWGPLVAGFFLLSRRPATVEQLRNVEGVSDIWMDRFGTKMLGKIVSVCREYPWLQTAAPVTKEKEPSEMLIKVWMYVCGCGCMCGVWVYCVWCGCMCGCRNQYHITYGTCTDIP